MRKFRSELYEAIFDSFMANFEAGLYTEAELREFEEDCFIDEDEMPQEEKVTEQMIKR